MINLPLRTFVRLILGAIVYMFYSYGIAEEITFGPEFEFTHKRMQLPIWGLNGQEEIAARSFAKRMEEICKIQKNCKVEEIEGKWEKDFKVTFTSGWWYKISYDPWCVEIQAKPMTLKEWRKRKDEINKYIFGTAADEGLEVDVKDGAGHIDFGARSAFGDDGELFLRYFVDFSNHPELAVGVLRKKNLVNAPPVIYLPDAQREALEKIIEDLDVKKPPTVKEMARKIVAEVYNTQPSMPPNDGNEEALHYQALGIKHLLEDVFPKKDRAMDIRSTRSQRNADEFILLAEMIEERIAFLKKEKQENHPVIFKNSNLFDESPEALVSCFYNYIREMGGSWEKYKNILPEEWRGIELTHHRQCSGIL